MKASPTRLDKVLKTKASPHRGAVNVNTNKPDSLYHNILYKKPNEKVKTPVREPEPIYSKQSTPEKHYIMQKETSPQEMPTQFPEADTIHINLNKDESYEIQQEPIQVVEPVFDVESIHAEVE